MLLANDGNTVKVHYTGRLEDGTIFDSSADREPLEFTIGEGQIIPGFEKAVLGKSVGEKVEVTILPEDAYGPYQEELVLAIAQEKVPPDVQVSPGQQVQLQTQDGRPVAATVTDVGEVEITVDANHPLAGKTLLFEIELLEVA